MKDKMLSVLTSVFATLLGLGVAVVGVYVLAPADGWQAVTALGLGLLTTGGSTLAAIVKKLSDPGPPARGHLDVQAIGALAGVAFAVALLVMLVVGHAGCSGSTYQAQRRAIVDWTPGPPCRIEVRLDGDPKPVVTVDAPEVCEPPPDVCPAVTP